MKYVCSGAILQCTHGTATSQLHATPKKVSIQGQEQANIADFVSLKNIPGFGRCRSLAYPPTASATAAHHGHLTPMPCVPGTCPKWQALDPQSLLCGEPALLQASTLHCIYGGTISIVNPGQTRESKVLPVSLPATLKTEEEIEKIEEEEFADLDTDKLTPDGVLDGIQLVLDAAGFIPVLGALPDLANAAISACRGNLLEAGMSLVAAVPGIGDVAGGAKIVYKGAKIAQKSGKAEKAAAKVLRSDSSKLAPKPVPARNVVTGKSAPASGPSGNRSYTASSPKKSETSSFSGNKRRTESVSSSPSANVKKTYNSQSGAISSSRRSESVGNGPTLKGKVTKSQSPTPRPTSVMKGEKISASYNNVSRQELRNERAKRMGITPEEMQKGGSHILYDKRPNKVSSGALGKDGDNHSLGQLSHTEKEKTFNREEYLNRTDCYYDDEVKSVQEIHKSFQPHRTPVTIKDKELSSSSQVSTNSSVRHGDIERSNISKGNTHTDAVSVKNAVQKSDSVQPSPKPRLGSLTFGKNYDKQLSNGKGNTHTDAVNAVQKSDSVQPSQQPFLGITAKRKVDGQPKDDYLEQWDKQNGVDQLKLDNPSNSPFGTAKTVKDSKASTDSKVVPNSKSKEVSDQSEELIENKNKVELGRNIDYFA